VAVVVAVVAEVHRIIQMVVAVGVADKVDNM
jgi:hypothetical protein